MLTETTILTIELTEDRPERFTGTPEQIVTEMNATAFVPAESPRAFMARFNRFSAVTHGETMRNETFAAFVEDLLNTGAALRVDSDKASD